MKLVVYGAGAVGGHLAARLLHAGCDVDVVARGAHLEAIRAHGLRLISGGETLVTRPRHAVSDPAELGPADIVFVVLKAPALSAHAEQLRALAAQHGTIVFVTNGIPWWWNLGWRTSAGPLPLLDRDGALWRTLDLERVAGCIVYSSNEVDTPGTIVHNSHNSWTIGRPDNAVTTTIEKTVAVLREAGLAGHIASDIRRDVWQKLVWNASGNTVGALTRRSVHEIEADPALQALQVNIRREVLNVAAAMGWDLRREMNIEVSPAGPPPLRALRSSMLQDVLQGRPTEVEALLGQLQQFAKTYSVPVPTVDVLLPLVRALDAPHTLQRANALP